VVTLTPFTLTPFTLTPFTLTPLTLTPMTGAHRPSQYAAFIRNTFSGLAANRFL